MRLFYLFLFLAIYSNAQFYGPNDFRISDAGGFGSTATSVDVPDLAYNTSSQNYLVVWESDDTDQNGVVDNNNQIIGRFTDLNGTVQGNDFLISSLNLGSNTLKNSDPRIAYNSTNNNFLVVYQGDLNSNKTEIYGVIVSPTGTITTTDFRITTTASNTDALTPGIAYNPVLNEYLVIYISRRLASGSTPFELEIYGQRLSSTGTAIGSSFAITDSTTGAQTNGSLPDVIFNAQTNEYVVTYVASPIVNEEEAYTTIVTQSGTVTTTTRLSNRGPIDNTGFANKWVRAAHNETNNLYLFIYEADNTTAGEIDVFGVIYDAAMNLVVPEFEISQVGGSDTRLDAVTAHIEWLPIDNTFYVVFQANPFFNNRNEREIFMRTVSATGMVGNSLLRVSEAPVGAAGSAALPRIASNKDGALLTVYRAEDTSTQSMMVNNEFEIYGQFYGTPVLTVDQPELSSLNLYPNPAKDIINFKNEGFENYTIHDLSGRIVQSGDIVDQNRIHTNLNSGIYLIEISGSNFTKSSKIIIK